MKISGGVSRRDLLHAFVRYPGKLTPTLADLLGFELSPKTVESSSKETDPVDLKLPCSVRQCSVPHMPKLYRLLSWEHPQPVWLSADALQQRGQILLEQLSLASRVEPGHLRDIRLALGAKRFPA